MVVFAFGVDELAEAAGVVDCPHRVAVGAEVGGLEHHVRKPARLDGLEQLVGVLERTRTRERAGDVLAVLEHVDAVPGVAGGVGGHEDGLDRVVLDHFFKGRVGLLAAAGLGQLGAAIGEQVADGRDRDVRMVLEAERRAEAADAVADDADAQLAIGDRRPFPREVWALSAFRQSLESSSPGRERFRQPQGRRQGPRSEERNVVRRDWTS